MTLEMIGTQSIHPDYSNPHKKNVFPCPSRSIQTTYKVWWPLEDY